MAFAFPQFLLLFSDKVARLMSLKYEKNRGNKIELINKEKENTDSQFKYILTFPKVEAYIEYMIQSFYEKLDCYAAVLDLIKESHLNRTPEVSFLNLTAALEVYIWGH